MAGQRKATDEAITLIRDAMKQCEQQISALQEAARGEEPSATDLDVDTATVQERLADAESKRDYWRYEAARLDSLIEDKQTRIANLKKQLRVAESGPDRVAKRELNHWREKVEQLETELNDRIERIGVLEQEATEDVRQLLEQQAEELEKRCTELQNTLVARVAELANSSDEMAGHVAAVERLEQKAREYQQELDVERLATKEQGATVAELQTDLETCHQEIDDLASSLESEREKLTRLESLMVTKNTEIRSLSDEVEDRNKLSESVDQNVQRLHQLEKRYLKRKEQITGLRAELNKVNQWNVALKRNVDTLRDQKNLGEKRQAKLSARVEDLKTRLATRSSGADLVDTGVEPDANVIESGTIGLSQTTETLKTRLEAQGQLIETLEREVAGVKQLRKELRERDEQIEDISAQLTTKQELITSLERDAENISRYKSRLRDGASEAIKLKSKIEKQTARITALENENEHLSEHRVNAELENSETSALHAELESERAVAAGLRADLAKLQALESGLKALAEGATDEAGSNGAAEDDDLSDSVRFKLGR